MCVLDRSVHQPTQWTVANVAHLAIIHLDGHAHLMSEEVDFQNGPVTANPTHTWGYNTGPLTLTGRLGLNM